MVAQVRAEIGPVAAFQQVIIVDRLPKTKSGKILRAILRRLIEDQPFDIPPTIEDETAIDAVKDAVLRHGYGGTKKLIFRDQLDLKNASTQEIE